MLLCLTRSGRSAYPLLGASDVRVQTPDNAAYSLFGAFDESDQTLDNARLPTQLREEIPRCLVLSSGSARRAFIMS